MAESTIRDITRRAVRAQIVQAADVLFAEQGYDATTIDQIAERVGISPRTFFRYIGSKEELVLAHFTRLSESFVERLAARPEGEDAWASLRRMFDQIVVVNNDPELHKYGWLAQDIVESSPTLLATHLERMESVQRELTGILLRKHQGDDWRGTRALVGSAFACMSSVVSRRDDAPAVTDMAGELDRVMGSVRPLTQAPN
ncbi:AcrR family transcriptional regulator [Leucobacter exalbidus]|uniref:AcrR family transcriptional regulator n=1 Tax=Leucobacter exalbidus TaxID=662960 RepID=A0A940PUS3_9MICO|nr:TetR/AcrR family transcriptional regulator [Leucobacter exalbidus]MBP1326600.1 AcrR family transcriptional regulator [Leucobacter exalbidus]